MIKDRLGRFSLARLDLRQGGAVHVGDRSGRCCSSARPCMPLAKLYTQQRRRPAGQAPDPPGRGRRRRGLDTAQVQMQLQDQPIRRLGGQPNFEAVVLRARTGPGPPPSGTSGSSTSRPAWPSGWGARASLAYVYIRSPAGPGRMLVVGARSGSTRTTPASSRRLLHPELPGGDARQALQLPADRRRRAARGRGHPGRHLDRLGAQADPAGLDVAGDRGRQPGRARSPRRPARTTSASLAESFNRMTDNLAQKIGELEHVGSLQARFVSDVSHELRTPWPRCVHGRRLHPRRPGPPRPTPSGPPCCWNASWSGSRTCSRTWRSAASTPA